MFLEFKKFYSGRTVYVDPHRVTAIAVGNGINGRTTRIWLLRGGNIDVDDKIESVVHQIEEVLA